MADSNFIDYVKVLCRSGKGGAGSRHFHRAKYVPKGGPDGGDGGRGGHIILRGNSHMWTLLPLRYRRHIFAGNGQSGSGGRSFGKDGEDVVVEVPCGTVVFDAETGEFLCEVTEDGEEIKLLRGGRGGRQQGPEADEDTSYHGRKGSNNFRQIKTVLAFSGF